MKELNLLAALALGLIWSTPLVSAEDIDGVDGTFETTSGWKGIAGAKTIEVEDDNHFLRFQNPDPNEVVAVEGRIPLDPAWTRIEMSARLRGTIKAKGKEGWYAPRLTFTFQDVKNQKVGEWPNVLQLDQSSDEWITISHVYPIPEDAVSLFLTPGLWGTSGVFDMDDLTVISPDAAKVATPEKNVAHVAGLRVLTLGDSITAMFRYQPLLRDALQKEGVKSSFVGSGGENENQHEGHSGWSIGQIEDNVSKYISDADANVVLLQIGVNNMNHGLGLKGKNYPPYQESTPAQGAQPGKTLNELGASWGDKTYRSGYLADRVNGLLDKILSHPNAPLLVVAKIPGIGLGNPKWKAENDECEARIEEFNAILETAVRARQAKGLKVEIVNNHDLGNRAYGTGPEFTWGTEAQQSGDWVHPRPDAAIWKGIAINFADGIKRLVKP